MAEVTNEEPLSPLEIRRRQQWRATEERREIEDMPFDERAVYEEELKAKRAIPPTPAEILERQQLRARWREAEVELARLTVLVDTGGDRKFVETDEFGDRHLETENRAGYAFGTTPEGVLVKRETGWTPGPPPPPTPATVSELIEAARDDYAQDGNGVALMRFAATQGAETVEMMMRARASRTDRSWEAEQIAAGWIDVNDPDRYQRPDMNDPYWVSRAGVDSLVEDAQRFTKLDPQLTHAMAVFTAEITRLPPIEQTHDQAPEPGPSPAMTL